MKQVNLQKTLNFTNVLYAFERTARSVRVPETNRVENDAEHSYLLAMLGWYLVDTLGLSLDKTKVFQYALAHDLTEVYAGDTAAFGKGNGVTKDTRTTKEERERAALQKIHSEFSEFTSLAQTIEEYEKHNDAESKFVYALDKLVPIFGGFMQNGRDWKEFEITFDDVKKYKANKIQSDPVVYALYEQIMELMDKDRLHYFIS
jgi:5'-deoxynucleotidase YfbR-like HD superfamily hydrolase